MQQIDALVHESPVMDEMLVEMSSVSAKLEGLETELVTMCEGWPKQIFK